MTDVSVLHQVRRHGYTNVDNDVFAAGLSFRAVGVLCYMLSRPPNWKFSAAKMANSAKEGRDAVRTAMTDLVEAGFLLRRTFGGKNPRTEHYIRDSLQAPWPGDGFSGAGESDAGDSGVEDSHVGKSGVIVSTDLVITEEVTKEETTRDSDFEAFYKAMPKKASKGTARTAYARALKKATAREILEGAQRYAKLREGKDPQYTKTPGPWLNAEKWLDEEPEVPMGLDQPTVPDEVIDWVSKRHSTWAQRDASAVVAAWRAGRGAGYGDGELAVRLAIQERIDAQRMGGLPWFDSDNVWALCDVKGVSRFGGGVPEIRGMERTYTVLMDRAYSVGRWLNR